MKKRILFRADGNSEIGLGHLYRLFALVEMYKEVYEFTFITKSNTTISVIPKEYPVVLLPENITIEKEPEWLANKFKPNEYIVIADGYQFVSSYQKEIKKQGFQLMYIDDLTTEYMYADIVVNHSPSVTKFDFKSKSYTKFALGTDYAILRPLFLNAANKTRKINKKDTAFVCFGGSDPNNFTLKTVNQLLKIKEIKKIIVVFGGAYKHKDIFRKDKKVKTYQNISEQKLIYLMIKSHIAFVSASTILYEVMTINLFTFSGFFVKNQYEFYQELNKNKIFVGMEDLNRFEFDKIPKLYLLIEEKNIKKQLKNQSELIDGNSGDRFRKLLDLLGQD